MISIYCGFECASVLAALAVDGKRKLVYISITGILQFF
jgi:hypothetical protein